MSKFIMVNETENGNICFPISSISFFRKSNSDSNKSVIFLVPQTVYIGGTQYYSSVVVNHTVEQLYEMISIANKN